MLVMPLAGKYPCHQVGVKMRYWILLFGFMILTTISVRACSHYYESANPKTIQLANFLVGLGRYQFGGLR